jgi:hypothetical protein
MATSIANVSATLESRIATVSALIPTSLTELGIVDGTAGQYLQTNANGTYSFTSVEGGGGGANIAAGTNIALTQNGVTVTDTTTSATINVVGVASAGTSAVLESRIALVSATMATSINNSNSAITALSATMATSINNRTAAITSVNNRLTTLSATMATSIANRTAAITSVNTRINSVSVLAETKASAATSANIQTRINTLSATMATSINNSNSAIATLSATMATSIANRTAAITSVNTRINSVSVLAETKASAATSANLQTRINTLSATMATSIANVSSALTSRITTLSATMATSIANVSAALESRINAVSAAMPEATEISKYYYTATSGQTVFSGADTQGNTLSYTGDNLTVTLNGLVLDGAADYTTPSGTSIVLATGATLSDELNIVVYDSFAVANALPLTGGTISGSLTVGGTVSAASFYGDGSNITGIIPSGTTMIFYQATAPTGWTKSTTNNNKALRVVSGSGGVTGGTTAFSTVFSSRTPSGTVSMSGDTGSHTLTTSQIPSHSHFTFNNVNSAATSSGPNLNTTHAPYQGWRANGADYAYWMGNSGAAANRGKSSDTGGGSGHSHSIGTISGTFSGAAMDFDVQYVDVILATKD